MGIITKHVRLVGSRGEHKADALFDSGASYSFLRRDVAESVATLEALPELMSFEMAQQGVTATANERVVVDFWIDSLRFSDEFLVLDNLSDEVIIGAKTMQAWRMKLDLEHEDVILDPRVTRLRFI